MFQLNEQLGVSTCWMPSQGETIFEAIEMAKDKGFKAFEIVPEVTPRFGHPHQVMSIGFYPGAVDEKFVGALAEAVADFSMVTVHSPNVDLNIASINPGIRQESTRQFLELIKLAHRIGANPVTFHHGQSSSNVNIDEREFERIIKHNTEFAFQALELAERYDLQLGYENLGGSTIPVEKVLLETTLERIGNPRFGLNLDIGHLPLVGGEPKEWITRFGPFIKEVHLHGTYYRGDRDLPLINHSPLEMEDHFDFKEILKDLKRVGFTGPMIFEIFAKDTATYLEFSQRGKEFLLAEKVAS